MRGGGRAPPPPSPASTDDFTLITECTPESRGCYSEYSVLRYTEWDLPVAALLTSEALQVVDIRAGAHNHLKGRDDLQTKNI
jgi:hypothetical protein